MIPNPWLILGAVGVALSLIVGAYFYGVHTTNTSRDKSALTAQLKAAEATRLKEAEWRTALDASQSALTKERQDAQKRESTLRADIDTGARKLRIAISRQQLPDGSEGTSGSDDATAELSANSRSIYFRLRAAIIADTQTINACQGYVRAIGAD